jgi:hypothetical protein
MLLLAVFLGMRFALATDLQAAAVKEQGYRSLGRTLDLRSPRHCGMASRERRVIGARQRQAHQRRDGGEQACRLPQGQAKEQPKRACGLDGKIGID